MKFEPQCRNNDRFRGEFLFRYRVATNETNLGEIIRTYIHPCMTFHCVTEWQCASFIAKLCELREVMRLLKKWTERFPRTLWLRKASKLFRRIVMPLLKLRHGYPWLRRSARSTLQTRKCKKVLIADDRWMHAMPTTEVNGTMLLVVSFNFYVLSSEL